MVFPAINPVAIQLGPVAIYWYGVMYVLGIGLSAWVLYRPVTRQMRWDLDLYLSWITAIIIGIVLGGRLGYVIVYDWAYYMHHPVAILHVWTGGMSFHGGLLGVLVATAWVAKRERVRGLHLIDWLSFGGAIGVFFGRLGNFINGELVGRVTTVPWGLVFPHVGPELRHPSQLYEAGLEGLGVGVFVWVVYRFFRLKPGQLAAIYLMAYSLARFVCEWFRQPDPQLGFVWGVLSMGQVLSLLGVGIGGLVFYGCSRRDA